jgi:hypothetical protein
MCLLMANFRCLPVMQQFGRRRSESGRLRTLRKRRCWAQRRPYQQTRFAYNSGATNLSHATGPFDFGVTHSGGEPRYWDRDADG